MTYLILTFIRERKRKFMKRGKRCWPLDTLNLILTNGVQSLNVVRDMITRNDLNNDTKKGMRVYV